MNTPETMLLDLEAQQEEPALTKTISLVTQRSQRCCSLMETGTSYSPVTQQQPRRYSQSKATIKVDAEPTRLRKNTHKQQGQANQPAPLPQDKTNKPTNQSLSILLNVRHLLPQSFLSKTEICQHNHGCFEHCIRKALKNFMIGFGIQMALKHILLLAKPTKLLKSLRKASTLLDCTRFGLFLMIFNSGYKGFLCLLRRLGSRNDRINAPIAGFISALSLAVDSGSRRELITVLMMSRAIESSLRLAETTGTIPKLQNRDLLLWMVANTWMQAAMGMRQSILNNQLRKFFQNWSQMKPNDKILVNVWSRMLKDGVPSF